MPRLYLFHSFVWKSTLLLLLSTSWNGKIFGQTATDESWRSHVIITNLRQINTPKTEYCPAFYGDGIVYPSSRRRSGPVDKSTGETYYDLYYAPIQTEGMLAKARSFSLELNSPTHEGPVAFNSDQDRIFFSRSKATRKRNGAYQMNIYEAQRGSRDWEDTKPMPFNDGEFSYMHPTISPAGDRLYFTSNMVGGFGGSDIYMVELINGRWSRPINLGPNINTPDNDAFPFIHPSGVLFFASQGHEGVGGYDIFMVNLGDPQEKIINLGKPFNSINDDFGIILDELGRTGYFSSNRVGGMGGDDIYSFQALDGIPPMKSSFQQRSTIQIVDATTGKPLPLAELNIFERRQDGSKFKLLTNSANETPTTDYTAERPQAEQRLTNRRGEYIQGFQSEKEFLIQVTKKGYAAVEYDYSTIGKIEPERILIKMSPIECFDLTGNVVDNNWEPLKNARIKVLNKCTNETQVLGVNYSGTFVYCLEIGCDFSIVAESPGFRAAKSEVSTKSIRGTRSMEIEMVLEPGQITSLINTPLKAGSTIILDKIYYDFDAYSIKQGAARELDELVALMKRYPSMEIELIAHTDSRGTIVYNLELSQQRANSAKQYMMNSGIAANRIKTFGYGEAKIRNHCVDNVNCSDEEHHYNRRTEVRVIRIDDDVTFEQKKGW